MKPTLSVIIPTHKRPRTLIKCLEHLERQTVRDDMEVIVISDGYDDETEHAAQSMKKQLRLTYDSIDKAQQGAARNRGVSLASGAICLYIGDDALLYEDACEAHLRAHEKGRHAVLGHVTWDPAVEITYVMKWLERSGWQFKFDALERYQHDYVPTSCQHRFTYTINVSLPVDIARAHPFPEGQMPYGWEDVVWGQELKGSGIRLYYESDARALHHHRLTMEDSLKRMETLGRSAVLMRRSHPDFDGVPTGMKLWAYHAAAMLPTMAGKHRRAFLQGISETQ